MSFHLFCPAMRTAFFIHLKSAVIANARFGWGPSARPLPGPDKPAWPVDRGRADCDADEQRQAHGKNQGAKPAKQTCHPEMSRIPEIARYCRAEEYSRDRPERCRWTLAEERKRRL